MKWYQAIPTASIKPVDVEKATESSVWVGGRRRARVSTYDCYFPTWDEAKKHLQFLADDRVSSLRKQLEYANGKAGSVRGLKNPES